MTIAPASPARWLGYPASLQGQLLASLLVPLWGLVLLAAVWRVLVVHQQLGQAQDARLHAALTALAQENDGVSGDASVQAPDRSRGAAQAAAGQLVVRIGAADGTWQAGERDWAAYPWPQSLSTPDVTHFYTSHLHGTGLRAAARRHAAPAGAVQGGSPQDAGPVLLQVGLPLIQRWPAAGTFLAGTPALVLAAAVALSLAAWAAVALAMRRLQRAVDTLGQPAPEGPPAEVPSELRALSLQVRAVYRSEHDWVDQQRRFLAEASHQLRTPMAVLRTQLQSAIDGTVAVREVLPQMLHTVDRATGLANQLLSLTKLEQIKRAGGLRPVDVRAAARDAVMELSPLIAAKRLDFSLDEAAVEAPADAVMLGELLRNLLANAIHHTPYGGRLGVLLRTGAAGPELVVWDEGPGVDDAVVPRLFQAFTATKGGVGLGLSICRQIAEAMGAAIQLYNRIDQGRIVGVDAVVAWGQGP